MSPRVVEVPIGPPYPGMNDVADYRKAKGFLVTAAGVDLARGIAQGFWAPGSTVAAVTAGSKFMYYQLGAGWLADSVFLADGTTNWACPDAPVAGNTVAYVTKVVDATTVNSPKAYFSGSGLQLGIPAPTTAASVNNVAGGTRTYSYTLYDPTLSYESNPKAIGKSTGCTGATVSGLPTTSTGTLATKIRIYGTNSGSGDGTTQYLLTELFLGTASWVDPGTNSATGFPLDWGAGGFYTTPTLNSDHAEAPLLTCLSDGPHASSIGLGKGGGIIFGAVGAAVRWSVLNRAFYWPALNQYSLPSVVLAMVSRETETYAFTESGIYAFSGSSDSAILGRKTRAHLGVLKTAGKSVVQTPIGTLYLSRLGITLFDGDKSTVISAGLLDPRNFAFGTYYSAGYCDGYYFISNGTNTWIVDLRTFPQSVGITKALTGANNAMGATAFHTVPATLSGGMTPGLYVNYDGQARPWRPGEQDLVSGAAQASFNIKTTGHDLDAPGKVKRITKVRAQVTGTVTLTLTADLGTGVSVTSTLALVDSQRVYNLPAGFDCLNLQAQAVAGTGASQLVTLSVIAEVFDAS